jgi:hypothetical protein
MGRLLLLLLVGLGVALYVDRSRAWLVERAGPLATPWHRWMTNQELDRIVEDLELHQATRGGLPIGGRGEFERWMADRYPQPRSRMDAWGTPYRAELAGQGRFRVVSAGPDGEFGTPDDLWREGARTATGIP